MGCNAPEVNFQDFKGGQNVTCQPYNAISQTTANHVYNVTVPSLLTIISREVLWRSTVTLMITNTSEAASEFAMNYDMNRPAGAAYYHKPRGSWNIRKIYALNAGTTLTPLVTDTEVYVQFTVTEPLLLSPFAVGSGYGQQGFYGIRAMNCQMVSTGNGNRAWRCAKFGSQKTVFNC